MRPTLLFMLLCFGAPRAWAGSGDPYRAGLRAYAADSLTAAKAYFTEAYRMDTASAGPRRYLARTLLRLGDTSGGARLLMGLQQGHNADAGDLMLLAETVHQPVTKRRWWQEALARDTTNVEALKSLGEDALARGDLPAAAAFLRRAAAHGADDAPTLGALGYALSRTGDSRAAISYLSRALAKSPTEADLYFHRAEALMEGGQGEAALLDLDQYAAYGDPDQSYYLYARGRALAEAGRPQEAIRAWEGLAVREPDFNDVLFRIGYAYAGLGNYGAALTAFDAAIHQHPDLGYLYANRASAKARMGQTDYCPDLAEAVRLGYREAEPLRARMCR